MEQSYSAKVKAPVPNFFTLFWCNDLFLQFQELNSFDMPAAGYRKLVSALKGKVVD
jgi:hypothetical protein